MPDDKVTTKVPAGMEVVTPVKGMLSDDQKAALMRNFVRYVAPSLGLFFGSLALQTDWKVSAGIGLLAFYQALSDFFSKLNSDTSYLRDK